MFFFCSPQGHTKGVNSVKFLPDGKAFFTASEDGSCRLWDLRSQQQVQMYTSDDDNATQCCSSASGAYLYAGYSQGAVRVFDTVSGEVRFICSAH